MTSKDLDFFTPNHGQRKESPKIGPVGMKKKRRGGGARSPLTTENAHEDWVVKRREETSKRCDGILGKDIVENARGEKDPGRRKWHKSGKGRRLAEAVS